MQQRHIIEPIGYIKTDFKEKFGVPRQSGLIDSAKGTIIFYKAYQVREAFKGLEDFSHIWVIWQFSESARSGWSPTVRPPRLGGNERKGVFATRSPFRPNSIAMSCLKINSVEFDSNWGPLIHVSGVDMIDETPIYDIKPYIYTDCHPEALSGFAEKTASRCLEVEISSEISSQMPPDALDTILKILAMDPRPAYQSSSGRVYGMNFSDYEISFIVRENVLTVTEIKAIK